MYILYYKETCYGTKHLHTHIHTHTHTHTHTCEYTHICTRAFAYIFNTVYCKCESVTIDKYIYLLTTARYLCNRFFMSFPLFGNFS